LFDRLAKGQCLRNPLDAKMPARGALTGWFDRRSNFYKTGLVFETYQGVVAEPDVLPLRPRRLVQRFLFAGWEELFKRPFRRRRKWVFEGDGPGPREVIAMRLAHGGGAEEE
jgi:hypothetical protein